MNVRRFASAALLAAVAPVAMAGGHLQVGSTRVELLPGARATRLALRNTGDAPVGAQVRVYDWSQPEGEDRLDETHAIALSPPIVRIAPGEEQVVRIVRQGPAPTGRDATYRVVAEEVPLTPQDANVAVGFRMRFVLPLFDRSADAAPAQLSCRLSTDTLTCLNAGGRACKLGATRLIDAGGRAVELTNGLFGYVLPHSSRRWTLSADRLKTLGDGLRLKTKIDNASDLELAVERTAP
jgi:fimbrial chaperone protein